MGRIAIFSAARAASYRHASIAAILLAVFVVQIPSLAGSQSLDEDVFASQTPPNVALIIDNSNSMDHPIYHEAYNNGSGWAGSFFTCDPFKVNGNEALIEGVIAGASNNRFRDFMFDDDGKKLKADCRDDARYGRCKLWLEGGDYTDAVPSPSTEDHPSTVYLERTFCGNTVKIWIDGPGDAFGDRTIVAGKYVAWLYSLDQTSSTPIGPPGFEATPSQILSDIDSSINEQSYITGMKFGKYQRTRMTAARDIISDVIYRTNTDCPAYTPSCTHADDRVRFGLGIFDPQDHGGYMRVPIDEYSNNRSALESAIANVQSSELTPLAESLFKIYTYFMSRDPADIPYGKGSSPTKKFPSYGYRSSDGAYVGTSLAADSPVIAECQKNFVIMVTDGAPYDDNFDDEGSTRGRGFDDFDELIGDYFVDDPTDADVPEVWSTRATGYLDDVAAFMQDHDFRPDFPNTMNTIDTYTVGFTTSGRTNALLAKTAANGNGLFFTGNQADVLTEALVSSVQDIISKSQGFSAATVPAARTADGGLIYTSAFQPSPDRSFWPGYLRAYKITLDGQILDRDGNCALTNLADPNFCAGGTFLNPNLAPPYWDASSAMPAPNARTLRVSLLDASDDQVAVAWDHGRTLDDLGLAASYTTEFPPHANVTASSDLDEAVVAYLAGCEWGTGMTSSATDTFDGCTTRTIISGSQTVKDLLGDIFHSNPVVVGPPSAFIPEVSYHDFANDADHVHRERVILAGANDGFFHGFSAGTWNGVTGSYTTGTGVEKFGFMPWSVRTKVADLAKTSSTLHPISVDGSPSVSDVWIDSDNDPTDAKQASEWRTYAISGLREGGESYFALDVTNPAASGYPGYLWEFPEEDDTSWQAYVAQTWSQPVITRIRLEDVNGDIVEKWVAIIGFGYDPTGDPNRVGPGGYSASALEGRGIAMLDVETGVPIAVRKFGAATGDVAGMLFAMPSQPAVLDANQDGFADLVYIGDLGGNVWKWVIKQPGTANPAANELYQPNWSFRKFFSDDPSRTAGARARSFFFSAAATIVNGVLHIGIGTGERADMNCSSTHGGCTLANRFYVLKDRDPWDSGSPETIDGREYPTGDLTDVTPEENNCPGVQPQGFYFTLAGDGEKFVTNSEVFNAFFFASTFEPDVTNVCDPTGDSLLYGFLAKCGQGFFGPKSSVSPIAGTNRTLDIGKGVPTDARLSIAPGNGSNRLIISKQDGELINIDSGQHDSDHGVMYWRELD